MFQLEQFRTGRVEAVTRRQAANGSSINVASIQINHGPVVIARLAEEIAPGAEVVLGVEDGAPIARRH